MNILITNDDNINAPGIDTLVKWATKLGNVTVVAPKFEQSGKSCSIELHKAFEIKKIDKWPGVTTYTVDSTPSDCIRFAVANLDDDFDLVLSGINNGFNMGVDIIYSGTCGAIFEAETTQTKAIAFSCDYNSSVDEKDLQEAYDFIISHNLFDYCNIYNVNIVKNRKDVLITRQGPPFYRDRFVLDSENMFKASGYSVYNGGTDFEFDIDAVMNGYTSISPLTVDRTNLDAYRKITSLK